MIPFPLLYRSITIIFVYDLPIRREVFSYYPFHMKWKDALRLKSIYTREVEWSLQHSHRQSRRRLTRSTYLCECPDMYASISEQFFLRGHKIYNRLIRSIYLCHSLLSPQLLEDFENPVKTIINTGANYFNYLIVRTILLIRYLSSYPLFGFNLKKTHNKLSPTLFQELSVVSYFTYLLLIILRVGAAIPTLSIYFIFLSIPTWYSDLIQKFNQDLLSSVFFSTAWNVSQLHYSTVSIHLVPIQYFYQS